MKTTRRNFLATTAIAAGLATTAQAKPWRKSVLEKLRVGVVGFGGRGKGLIGAVNKSQSATLVALADVDQKILGNQDKGRTDLFRSQDFRHLLDRKDIDVIVSATPNHWHALLTVMAVESGKHVYIEKPISYNMFESRAVVVAARRHEKLVQCGFQNRSDNSVRPFFERLNKGEFGKVLSVHGTCYRPRKSIGKLDQPLKIPSHIDYSLWLGPAEEQPIYRPRLHYDWHWDFNTGNGDVGNQGPHEWDMMNWALGDTGTLPTTIRAAGNRFGWNDAGNTPNVMAISGVKDSIPFTFEVMDLKPGCKPPHGRGVGVIVETEKGRFVGGRGGGKFITEDGAKPEEFKRSGGGDPTHIHMQNLFDAILANDRKLLRADCGVASKSSSMAHMANISYRLGNEVQENAVSEGFSSHPTSAAMAKRLLLAPGIFEPKQTGPNAWQLGPQLAYDNASNQFTGESPSQANSMIKRPEERTEFKFPVM